MFLQMAGEPKASAALEVAAKMRIWANSQGIQVIHALLDINAAPFPTCKDGDMFAGIMAAMRSNGGEESTELLILKVAISHL
jgi:hypothetical protein